MWVSRGPLKDPDHAAIVPNLLLAFRDWVYRMILEVAQKLQAPLRPDDLALLQNALIEVCEIRGEDISSLEAEEHAKVLIMLFQSGIRRRHQLIAMLTGRRLP